MSQEPVIRRMRHEGARRRQLTVAAKRQLAPDFLAIDFTCADFVDFVSAGADDHIKLFIPGAAGADGRPAMRDYTPRAFDVAAGTLTIEFALHDAPGPATAWAIAARPGDTIAIGGPRGSLLVPADFDWYWLIGDEAALPAIARRLAELPEARVDILAAIPDETAEITLPLGHDHRLEWIHRPAEAAADPAALLAQLARRDLPVGAGFVWIAAEAGVAKALREAVLAKGQPLHRLRAAGYWTAGHADTTARFDEG